MLPGRPPFRADHIGSLLRPKALRDAFKRVAEGRLDRTAFAEILDDAIRDVVKLQEEVGLKVVNDGEFRRASYWSRFVERVDGFVIKPAVFKFRDDSGREVEFTSPYAISKIARVKPIALDEFDFLRGITRLVGKVTLPAPSTMHFYRCTDYADPKAYSDPERLFDDLGRAYREEIAALAQAGCRYVQIDEVAVAMLCDPAIRDRMQAAKQQPDALVQLYTDAINKAIEGAPQEMTIGVHLCRGNFKGNYLSDGGYAPIAERFFGGTKVNHFLLEYDSPRAGDFAPLRFVPRDKGVVLGLISTKTAKLEDLDGLKRRTDEAARYVDLDRLAISPQCGFASTVAGNPVTEMDERAKLRRVVEAADAIWR